MTCQSNGRSPTIAMGFGPLETPSRIRMPRPPQKRTTFMDFTLKSANLELRNREDQPASPRPDVFELPGYLLAKIPGKYENVIGLGLGKVVRCENRDMRAGQEFALLDRTPVDRIRKKIGSDAAMVQQRVPFTWRAVASDRPAVPGGAKKEFQQVGLDLQYLVGESLMPGYAMQARGLFTVQHVFHVP